MSNQAIHVKNLSFDYEDNQILQDVSFSLKKGEVATLIGASGSGKSTLFKLLTGLITVKYGELTLNNQSIPAGYQSIAYMMQEDLLLPWRTVLDNMTLITELGSSPSYSKQLQEESLHLLNEMGLKGCEHLYPHELSGGMRQRVALARTLLQKKPILLLDEPFGALDVGLRENMYRLLRKVQEKHHTTILLVTHDFRDALVLSDRILFLADGVIQKEWHIPLEDKNDLEKMGLLQRELQLLFLKDEEKIG